MGIINRLFKPSVKKMKETGDVDGLIRTLTSNTSLQQCDNNQIDAIEALGEMKDRRAIVALIAALDYHPSLEARARDALIKLGAFATELLLAAFTSDPSVNIQRNILEIFGEVKDPKAIDFLIRELGNQRTFAGKREIIAESLAKIGVPSISELINALKGDVLDRNSGVFDYAIASITLALKKIGTPAVAPLIVSLKEVEGKVIKDKQGWSYCPQSTIASVLGEIGDIRAVEPLTEALYLCEDDNISVNWAVVDALIVLKAADKALQLIIDYLRSNDSTTRGHAIKSLITIGEPSIAPLINFLESESDKWARASAIEALGEIGDNKALNLLTSLSQNDPVSHIRQTAQKALKRLRKINR